MVPILYLIKMFRINFHSPDNWLVGVNRFQHEDEAGNEYEALAIGILFFSIEFLWIKRDKIIA